MHCANRRRRLKKTSEEEKARKQRRLRREIERKVSLRKKDNQEIRSSLLEQQKEREDETDHPQDQSKCSPSRPQRRLCPSWASQSHRTAGSQYRYQRSEELGKLRTHSAQNFSRIRKTTTLLKRKIAEEKTQTVAQQALNAQEKYTAFIEEQKAALTEEEIDSGRPKIETPCSPQERLNAQSDIYSEQPKTTPYLFTRSAKHLQEEKQEQKKRTRSTRSTANKIVKENRKKKKNQALRDQLSISPIKQKRYSEKRRKSGTSALSTRERKPKKKYRPNSKNREARKTKRASWPDGQQSTKPAKQSSRTRENTRRATKKRRRRIQNTSRKIALREQQAAEDLQQTATTMQMKRKENQSKRASLHRWTRCVHWALCNKSRWETDTRTTKKRRKKTRQGRTRKSAKRRSAGPPTGTRSAGWNRKARRRKEEADQAALRIAQEIKKQQETIDTVVQKNRTWRDWFRAFYLDPASDERVLDAVEKAQEEISLSLMRQAEIAQEEQALLFTQELEQEKQAQQQKDQEKQKAKNENCVHIYKNSPHLQKKEILFENFHNLKTLSLRSKVKFKTRSLNSFWNAILKKKRFAPSDTQQKLAADSSHWYRRTDSRRTRSRTKKATKIALRSQQAQALEERRERKERLEQREDHLAKAKAELAQELALSRMDAGEQAQLERKLRSHKMKKPCLRLHSSRWDLHSTSMDDLRTPFLVSPRGQSFGCSKRTDRRADQRTQSAAYRKRERQRREQQKALEEQRQQEHKERIRRLTLLRAKEEERILEYKKQEQERIQELAEKEQKQWLRTLSTESRHDYYRSFAPSVIVDHREKDLRGANLLLSNWPKALLSRSLLQATQLSMSNLMEADFGSPLDGSRLDEATLDGALMEKATLIGTSLQHGSLLGAQLRLTRLIEADVRYADFQRTNLQDSDWAVAMRAASLQEPTFIALSDGCAVS